MGLQTESDATSSAPLPAWACSLSAGLLHLRSASSCCGCVRHHFACSSGRDTCFVESLMPRMHPAVRHSQGEEEKRRHSVQCGAAFGHERSSDGDEPQTGLSVLCPWLCSACFCVSLMKTEGLTETEVTVRGTLQPAAADQGGPPCLSRVRGVGY